MLYLALLRAINVGGKRIVKMDELRSAVAELGHINIRTYIQSGNLVFESAESDREALTRQLEALLLKHWGFAIPCVLLKAPDLQAILAALPPITPEQRLNVYFLGDAPAPEAKERLQALEQPGLAWHLLPRALILKTAKDLQDKRLNNSTWLEKQLGTWATARNHKTTQTLAAWLGVKPSPESQPHGL
ncbi:MAG: DUF1697 domain-containing protein [Candidatus Sericytochromatia bacterium]|nr:DUF1697 domain-containing protein [Candidatus Sericytochromatia bacterium]